MAVTRITNYARYLDAVKLRTFLQKEYDFYQASNFPMEQTLKTICWGINLCQDVIKECEEPAFEVIELELSSVRRDI